MSNETNRTHPIHEAVRLYNLFNSYYMIDRPEMVKFAKRFACHSAQVHIDIIRKNGMSAQELTFWADVYNELEKIKKSI